jgi:hypothetical protein
MKINKIIIIPFVISIIALASCEKVIDMNIDEQDPKIVLISNLNPDSLIEVNLTRSLHILDYDSVIFIETAKVEVYENDVLIEELPYNTNSHSFRSNTIKPAIGKRYRIEASADGYKDVSVEAVIPIPVEIASIDTFKSDIIYMFDQYSQAMKPMDGYFAIRMSFKDPGQDENFYIISIKYKEFNNQYYYDHETFNSTIYLNSILIEYSSESELFNFIAESDNGGINVGNNEGNYINAKQLAFSDKAINGKQVNLELHISNDVYPDSIHYYIRFTSISKDYYKYIASESLYQNSDDPFTERVQMYNNIENGLGVLLSSSNSVKSFTRKKNYTPKTYGEK